MTSKAKKREVARRRQGQRSPGRQPARHGPRGTRTTSPHRTGRAISWVCAAATVWAVLPALWPGGSSRPLIGTAAFGIAVLAVAGMVARTTALVAAPGDTYTTWKRGLLLVLLVAVPVVFDPRTSDAFNLAKYTAVVVGALGVGAVWLVEAVHRHRLPRWRNGLHWPVLALVGWTAVATAASVSPRQSLLGDYGSYDGLYATVAFAVLFFAFAEAFDIGHLKTVLSVLFFGGGGIVTLYGLIQLHDLTWPNARWDWLGVGNSASFSNTIFSTLGNPNHLSAFLAVIVPIGAMLFLLHRDWRVRALIVLVEMVAVVELLRAASRGALAGSAAAAVVLVVCTSPELRRRPRVLVPALVASVVVVVAGTVTLATATGFSNKLATALSGETLSQRVELWKAAVRMANDSPVLGHGPDTYANLYPAYKGDVLVRRFGEDHSNNGAHNVFMNHLAASGYPGLVGFTALLAFAATRTVRTWRRLRAHELAAGDAEVGRARDQRLVLAAIAAGLLAYVTAASFNINQVGLSFVFWALLGLLCAVAAGAGVPVQRRAVEAASAVATTPPAQGRADVTVQAAAVLAVVGLIVAAHAASAPLRADHNAWVSARDTSRANAEPDNAERLAATAGRAMERAVALNPWEPSYLVRQAESRARGASRLPAGSPERATAFREALDAYERAIALAPGDDALLERYADLLLGDDAAPGPSEREAAIRALRRAVQANPYSRRLADKLERARPGNGAA